MLPFRHIGDPKPEHWVGLIDAVYAIAMTVLALMLPENIGESLRLFETTRTIEYLLTGFYQTAFYLLSFLIFYEVWCFHRTILVMSTSKNRRQNVYTGIMLGIVCLAPAWTGAVFKNVDTQRFWIENQMFATVATFGWVLAFLMYFLVYCIGSSADNIHTVPALRVISKEARTRSIFFAWIAAFHAVRIFIKDWPFLPSVLILAVYVLISFNQDSVTRILQQFPNPLRQSRPMGRRDRR